jgi:hypothetical protein
MNRLSVALARSFRFVESERWAVVETAGERYGVAVVVVVAERSNGHTPQHHSSLYLEHPILLFLFPHFAGGRFEVDC